MITTGARRQDVIRLYGEAASLLKSARRGRPQQEICAEAARILSGFEERFDESRGHHEAARSLRRWARDVASGRYVVASVHLDRAGLSLGVRGSAAREALEETLADMTDTPQLQIAQPWPDVEAQRRRWGTRGAPPEAEVAQEPAATSRALTPRTSSARSSRESVRQSARPSRPAAAVTRPQSASPPSKPTPRPAEPTKVTDPLLAGLSPAEQDLVSRLPVGDEALKGAAALAECWGGTMSPTSARGRYSRLASKLERQHSRPILMRGSGRYGRLPVDSA